MRFAEDSKDIVVPSGSTETNVLLVVRLRHGFG